ncbi:MAG: hypothetical protein AB1489_16455 [Acidobacteriota bacterium]
MEKKRIILLIPLILTLTLLTTVAEGKGKGNGNGNGKPINRVITLNAVGADSDASGFARIFFKGGKKKDKQTFQVKVEKVDGSTTFTVVVDGTTLDTFTSTPGGTFEAIYETDPKGSHRLLPTSLTPVTKIKLIEIKKANGDVILSGSFAPPDDDDDDDDETEVEIKLVATGVDSDAKGEAEIEIEKENGTITKQELEVEVKNLAPSTSFKLFINGTEIAAFSTNSTGRGGIEFSNNPKGDELPLPTVIDPLTKVKLVEIRTVDGQIVLMGMFQF